MANPKIPRILKNIYLLTLAGVSLPGWGSPAHAQLGPISQLVFTTEPQTLVAGTSSQIMTVQTQDEFGNPIDVIKDIEIRLLSTFFETSDNWAFSVNGETWTWGPAKTIVTISSGTNSVSFYLRYWK